MHVYRYGTLMRPPGPGAVPREGLIQAFERPFTAKSGKYCWGLAEYERPLTENEISDYQLEYITDYELGEPEE